MPRCPKCGKEIDHLVDYSPVWEEYELRVDTNGNVHWEFMNNSVPMDAKDDEYECPECHKVLFTDAEDAINFLKGNTKEVIEK